MQNSSKKTSFFTLEERKKLIEEVCKDIENVDVIQGEGTAVRLAKLYECQALIRGLRGVTDFDDEIRIATANRKIINNEISTVCFFPDQEYQYISSSTVRELFWLNESITDYVEPIVEKTMIKKYPHR